MYEKGLLNDLHHKHGEEGHHHSKRGFSASGVMHHVDPEKGNL